jgi:alpha-mannosidase
MRAVSTGLHDGQLPASGSFISVEPHQFVISAIKEAEKGRGWLVRGYNISSEEINVTLKTWRISRRLERVNLAEEKLSGLRPRPDGSVTFPVRGHEIATVEFRD